MGNNLVDLESRRVHRRPTARYQARRLLLHEAASVHEAADPVLNAAQRATTLDLLYAQRDQIAEESAALKFQRLQGTGDIARLSSRRIRALRAVANSTLQIEQQQAGIPSSSATRTALYLLLDDVLTAAHEVLGETSAQQFSAAIRGRLDAGLMEELIALR